MLVKVVCVFSFDDGGVIVCNFDVDCVCERGTRVGEPGVTMVDARLRDSLLRYA